MDKQSDFYKRSEAQIVYWKNTVDNVYAVFKLTPEGDTYTKCKGIRGEYKSNDSKMAVI